MPLGKEDDDEDQITTVGRDGLVRVSNGRKAYSSVASSDTTSTATSQTANSSSQIESSCDIVNKSDGPQHQSAVRNDEDHHLQCHHDSSTFDYIGLTHELFPCNNTASRTVLWFYYTNIFLVLGE